MQLHQGMNYLFPLVQHILDYNLNDGYSLLPIISKSIDRSLSKSSPSNIVVNRELQIAEKAIFTLFDDTERIESLAFSPDGSKLASCSDDAYVHIWDATEGWDQANKDSSFELLTSFTGDKYKPVNAVAFSPDGILLASGSNPIKIWNVTDDWSLVKSISGHNSEISCLTFSPDGSILVSGSGSKQATRSADDSIKIWNTDDWSLQKSINGTSYVEAIAFSPDGSRLASSSSNKSIRIWAVNSNWNLVKTIKAHTSVIYSIAFSPDGTKLVSGSKDNSVKVWNAADDWSLLKTIPGPSYVYSVAISPDGNLLATGLSDFSIKLWDITNDWSYLAKLKGHTDRVSTVVFNPNGTLLASGGFDASIKIWDTSNHPIVTLTNKPTQSPIFEPSVVSTQAPVEASFTPTKTFTILPFVVIIGLGLIYISYRQGIFSVPKLIDCIRGRHYSKPLEFVKQPTIELT